jgi:hypothetical protein
MAFSCILPESPHRISLEVSKEVAPVDKAGVWPPTKPASSTRRKHSSGKRTSRDFEPAVTRPSTGPRLGTKFPKALRRRPRRDRKAKPRYTRLIPGHLKLASTDKRTGLSPRQTSPNLGTQAQCPGNQRELTSQASARSDLVTPRCPIMETVFQIVTHRPSGPHTNICKNPLCPLPRIYQTHNGDRRYCSPECNREAHRLRKAEKLFLIDRLPQGRISVQTKHAKCPNCGKRMTGEHSVYDGYWHKGCPASKQEAKRLAKRNRRCLYPLCRKRLRPDTDSVYCDGICARNAVGLVPSTGRHRHGHACGARWLRCQLCG